MEISQSLTGVAFAGRNVFRQGTVSETAPKTATEKISENGTKKTPEADPTKASKNDADKTPKTDSAENTDDTDKTPKTDSTEKTDATDNTDEKDQAKIEKLKKRDREVRTHEQAHAAAGGAYVSGAPSYEYKTGPDGKKYAVGGEVQIDTSRVPGDPQATAQKMRVIKKAALAPAEPSSQDRAVAAEAGMREMKALAEYRKASLETSGEKTGDREERIESRGNEMANEASVPFATVA